MSDSVAADGYRVVRGALGADVIEPIRDLISRHVDTVARELYARGETPSLFSDLPFERRLAALYEGRESGLRKWSRFLFSPEMYRLATAPALLDALEQALGPEVIFHGDFQLVPKLPGNQGQAYPWHQDTFYYGVASQHLRIITVWVPLVDVDERNGTLWVMPGSHRWGLLEALKHDDGFYRPTEDVERRGAAVAMRMRAGDVLLLTNQTFHASDVNPGSTVRWTIDLGYSAIADPDRQTADERASHEYLFETLERMGRTPLVVRSADPARVESWDAWARRRQDGRPHVGP